MAKEGGKSKAQAFSDILDMVSSLYGDGTVPSPRSIAPKRPSAPAPTPTPALVHATAAPAATQSTPAAPAVDRAAGVGVDAPLVLVIGAENAVQNVDERGPFAGPAGLFLDEWLAAIGLDKAKNVYISSLKKPQATESREDLAADIVADASLYKVSLVALIEARRPTAILSLGIFAAAALRGQEIDLSQQHGRTFSFHQLPVFPIYDPEFVLQNPGLKRDVWQVLKRLHAYLLDLELVPKLPAR